MKVATILGTRPEIIRLSRMIPLLDRSASRHILIHTGQNHHRLLSDIFFHELGLRRPDVHIGAEGSTFGRQAGRMFALAEAALEAERPDILLVLGDTNSALCSLVAARMGIPVYHMEAGNRCYDPHVPEEINRRVIDSVSTFNLPYTQGSRENLLREGHPPNRVWVTGNPIREVIRHYRSSIQSSDALERLGLKPGKYLLVTAHRAENVDRRDRLESILQGVSEAADSLGIPAVMSVHPRTRSRLDGFGLDRDDQRIRLCPPFGFFDFLSLQQGARCVVTDSGTVQEESCLFGIPAVTIRDSTERPETVTCGSNVVSGLAPERIRACVEMMAGRKGAWTPPPEYLETRVSEKVVNMILGGCSHV